MHSYNKLVSDRAIVCSLPLYHRHLLLDDRHASRYLATCFPHIPWYDPHPAMLVAEDTPLLASSAAQMETLLA